MLDMDTLAVFFVASIALALAPGPDNIFVLMQSAMHGKRAGLIVTGGLCSGLIFHTAAVALGVAAIFNTSLLAFNLLKSLGAAYLLYLAYQALRAAWSQHSTDLSPQQEPPLKGSQLYLRGLIMNISNPKVAIFFLAFLPQFIDAETEQVGLQVMSLGCVFMLATALVFSAVAVTAGFLAEKLKSSARIQSLINAVAGTVFVGLAVKLVMTPQS